MQSFVPSRDMWTAAVPEHQQFMVPNYGIGFQTEMYINYGEANKVYVGHNGEVQNARIAPPPLASQTVIGNFAAVSPQFRSGQPMFGSAENGSGVRLQYAPPLYTNGVVQAHSRKRPEILENCNEKSKNNGVASPIIGCSDISSPDWHTLTDAERGVIQRERRKAHAYKTALCQSYRTSGTCEYGSECRFAHGEKELRLPPQPHPKYKTQLCNKYSVSGSCPYGSRCQFIHQRLNNTVVLKTTEGIVNNHVRLNRTRQVSEIGSKYIANGFGDQKYRSDDLARKRIIPLNDSVLSPIKGDNGALKGRSESITESAFPWSTASDMEILPVDAIEDQHTRLSSRILAKRSETKAVQPQTDVEAMLENLFLNETGTEFSQSCFPRLSLSTTFSSTVKQK